MQATPDDGLWRVWNRSGQIWEIYPPIPTWNQDTYQETRKDLNVEIAPIWLKKKKNMNKC